MTDENAPVPPPSPSTAVAVHKPGLIERTADRYGLSPAFCVRTLKATVFHTDKPITDEQLAALLVVAEQYGLNPFTKELYAFPDKGRIIPYVPVDGWARIINDHPQFDGAQAVWDSSDGSMTVTMHRKDRTHPITITEYLDECRRETGPWKSHPRRMLRHKAMMQAARLAFGFAGIYDRDEAVDIYRGGSAPKSSNAAASRVSAALHGADLPMVEEVGETPPEIAPQTDPQLLADYRRLLADCADKPAALALMEEAAEILDPAALAALAADFATRWSNE